MGSPQLGSGKAERFESHQRDESRGRVTNRAEDAFAFRTPSLRNVTATDPYAHAGGHADQRGFLLYQINPAQGLNQPITQAVLPGMEVKRPDFALMQNSREFAALQASVQTRSVTALSDDDVTALPAFLETLTDEGAIKGRLGIPEKVRSGLPIDR